MEWVLPDELRDLEKNSDPLTRLTSSYYPEMEKAAVKQFELEIQKNADAVLPGSPARKELKSIRKLLRKQYKADVQLAAIQFFASKNIFFLGLLIVEVS